jgi:hypothetical protein
MPASAPLGGEGGVFAASAMQSINSFAFNTLRLERAPCHFRRNLFLRIGMNSSPISLLTIERVAGRDDGDHSPVLSQSQMNLLQL